MKAVIFGAGANTISFFRHSPVCRQLEVVKVVDNDKGKWGKEIGSGFHYVIESPESIMDVDYDIVIVTPRDSASIKYQLIHKLGVSENVICGCNELIVPSECNLGSIKLSCAEDYVYKIDMLIPNMIIPTNEMEDFYFKEAHNVMNKWWHYFEVYHQFFSKYIGTDVRILEIGVFKGGSMQMWKKYFGDKAHIVGIDIDERCKSYEADNIHICIGSQADEKFLKEVSEKWGPFDIILDDGSHIMEHQIITFETMFPLLKNGGVFICEDCHTSYMKEYGGGYKKKDSFIEYSKGFVDSVNSQFFEDKDINTAISDYIKACHYYDSMVVIEKEKRGYSIVTEFEQ